MGNRALTVMSIVELIYFKMNKAFLGFSDQHFPDVPVTSALKRNKQINPKSTSD